MNGFLHELAANYYQQTGGQLGAYTFVFPNKRAGLFFKKHLSVQLDQPIWMPAIDTIEHFFLSHAPLHRADTLQLIIQLYDVYRDLVNANESLDNFFYWGNMLLRDFDDVDKYLVPAESLFSVLTEQKRIDQMFGGLPEEQLKAIRQFWKTFEPGSDATGRFSSFWEKIYQLYSRFKQRLLEQQLGYTGMIYRYLLDHFDAGGEKSPVVFAGFNALTPVEQQLVSLWLKHHGAEIHWDIDAYYLEDEQHEAGYFLRKYEKDPVLKDTFPRPLPQLLKDKSAFVQIEGVAGKTAQTALAAQHIDRLIDQGVPADDLVVVLPDESLLFSVLHHVPERVERINVTMGYPLHLAPAYALLEHFIRLLQQIRSKQDGLMLPHRHLTAFLSHPYIYQKAPEPIDHLLKTIQKKNWLWIDESSLDELPDDLRALFSPPTEVSELFDSLQKLLVLVYHSIKEIKENELEIEFIYRMLVLLNHIRETLDKQGLHLSMDQVLPLIRQSTRQARVPFSGEPLVGLQIMGLLETRMLDFKHVIILSCNEGMLPEKPHEHSFIPYNLRKGAGLPTFEHQDSVAAYLFYRLLQEAESMICIYDSGTNRDTGAAEISRFLNQLTFETSFLTHKNVKVPLTSPNEQKPHQILKNQRVMDQLARFEFSGEQDQPALSPSAVHTYLVSPYDFYTKYVWGVKEQEEVEEDVDARIFGQLVHWAMEFIYDDPSCFPLGEVTAEGIERALKNVDGAIAHAFSKHFTDGEENITYEGRNVVIRDILKQSIEQILRTDAAQVPFSILHLEKKFKGKIQIETTSGSRSIALKGTIDRVDLKDGSVRILDYKSGREDRKFVDMAQLFERGGEKPPPKGAMQALFYCYLFLQEEASWRAELVYPAIYPLRDLFSTNFEARFEIKKKKGKGYETITEISRYLEPFLDELRGLLEEIWNEEIPFSAPDENFFSEEDESPETISSDQGA